MANKDVFDEKMDALAESINAKAGTSGALTLDGMKSAVDAIELGSNVVANPTLEGGEDDLTSIEIDGTKYAVPKGAYIAEMEDATHITQASLDYIVANYDKVPCFVVLDGLVAQISNVSGSTLQSACVGTSYAQNAFDLRGITISMSNRECSSSLGGFKAVDANPSVSTSAPELKSIKIRDTRYKIPTGSSVEANPTLAGTEGNLTGLEVDGTKYKVSSGTEVTPLSSVTGSEPIFRGLKIDGVDYQGYRTIVEVNAGHTASAPDLQDILIGDTTYKVPAGAYIAKMSSARRISTESLNYIYANYLSTPCYVIYNNTIYRIIKRASNKLYTTAYSGASSASKVVYLTWLSITDGDITEVNDNSIQVLANPPATGTNALTELGVGIDVFKIRDGAKNGLGYLTTAPTSANNDGIKIVVLNAEPATKYAGYLYIITA